jgi:hypothetical protein
MDSNLFIAVVAVVLTLVGMTAAAGLMVGQIKGAFGGLKKSIDLLRGTVERVETRLEAQGERIAHLEGRQGQRKT